MQKLNLLTSPFQSLNWAIVVFAFFLLSGHRTAEKAASHPGAISATFSANVSANYEIPIVIPPGVNGLQPKISVAYNSDASNGLLGMGFQLKGFSEIRRIGRTKRDDGIDRGITYTGEDRFALDGQRLLLSTGTYGKNAANYHTAQGIQQIITSHGGDENGPEYFSIQTKEGLGMRYSTCVKNSNTSSSQEGGSKVVWLLDRVTDHHGNYMVYEYNLGEKTDASISQKGKNYYYPTQVKYTYVPNQGNDAHCTIRFTYQDRSDQSISFNASQNTLQKRLSAITIEVKDPDFALAKENLTKSYEFDYEYSDFTSRSLLHTISFGQQVTTFTYPKGDVCHWKANNKYYPPSHFRLAEIYPGHEPLDDPGTEEATINLPFIGQLQDLNGDGRIDLLQYIKAPSQNHSISYIDPWTDQKKSFDITESGQALSWLNEGLNSEKRGSGIAGNWKPNSSFKPPLPLTADARMDSLGFLDLGATVVDIDGDGLKDMLVANWNMNTNSHDNRTYINTGSGFVRRKKLDLPQGIFLKSYRIYNVGWANGDFGAQLIDLNNDGLMDIVQVPRYEIGNVSKYIYIQKKDSSWSDQSIGLNCTNCYTGTFVNQGGKIKGSQKIKEGNDIFYREDQRVIFKDINGDGFPDMIKAVLLEDPNQPAVENQRIYATYINDRSFLTAFRKSPSYQIPDGVFFKIVLKDEEFGGHQYTQMPADHGFVDFNGDGLPDIIQAKRYPQHSGNSNHPSGFILNRAWRNTGNGFVKDEAYKLPSRVWLSHFERTGDEDPENIYLYPVADGAQLVDVNGDGLPDLVNRHFNMFLDLKSPIGTWLNTGLGWKLEPAYEPPTQLSTPFINQELNAPDAVQDGARFYDLNGDGLLDIIHNTGDYRTHTSPDRPYGGTLAASETWLNTGSGWKSQKNNLRDYQGLGLLETEEFEYRGLYDVSAKPGSLLDLVFRGKRLVDLNGDGLLDIMIAVKRHIPNNSFSFTEMNQMPADFDRVIGISNSNKSKIGISYAMLTEAQNEGGRPLYIKGSELKTGEYNLQYPRLVVKEYKVFKDHSAFNDYYVEGSDPYEHFRYQYKGLKSSLEAGYLGFEQISRIDLLSLQQWRTEYHQEAGMIGLIKKQEWTSSINPNLLWKKNEFTYEKNALNQNRLKTKIESIYDKDGHFWSDQSFTYEYDERDNIFVIKNQYSIPGTTVNGKGSYFTYYPPKASFPYGQLKDKLISTSYQGYTQKQIYDKSNGEGFTMIYSWERLSYDQKGNITTKMEWDDSQKKWIRTTFDRYDGWGSLSQMTSPEGAKITYGYDNLHLFQQTTSTQVNKDQRLIDTRHYDPVFGNLLQEIDPNGIERTYNYDRYGRLKEILEPAPDGDAKILESYSYQINNSTTDRQSYAQRSVSHKKMTDWKNNNYITEVEILEANGRKIGELKQENGEDKLFRRLTYNPKGQIKTEELFLSRKDVPASNFINLIQFSYTPRGDIMYFTTQGRPGSPKLSTILIEESKGDTYKTLTKTVQDAQGNNLKVEKTKTDPWGYVQSSSHIDPNTAKEVTTTFQYDLAGNVTTIEDPTGSINSTNQSLGTLISYNSRGQKTRQINKEVGFKNFNYGPNGLLKTSDDGAGNTVSYLYDLSGRLTQKTLECSDPDYNKIIRYIYDQSFPNYTAFNKGNLTTVEVVDTSNAVSFRAHYAYNRQGLLSRSEVWSATDNQIYVEEYEYDPQGNKTLHRYPDGGTALTSYDGQGNILTLAYKGRDGKDYTTYVTYSSYNHLGVPGDIQYHNGTSAKLDFNPTRHLPSHYQLLTKQNLLLTDKSYQWSQGMQLTAIIDNRSVPTDQKESQHFSYQNGRIQQTKGIYGDITYEYDKAGRISKKTISENNTVEEISYLKPQWHRTTQIISKKGDLIQDFNLTYGKNGNLTEKLLKDGEKVSYAYDAEAHLMKLQQGDQITHFEYDYRGILFRVKKEAEEGQPNCKLMVSASFELEKNDRDVISYTHFLSDKKGHVVALPHAGQDFFAISPKLGFSTPIVPITFIGQPKPWSIPSWFEDIPLLGLIMLLLGLLAMIFLIIRQKRQSMAHMKSWKVYLSPPLISAILFMSLVGPTGSHVAAQNEQAEAEPFQKVRYFHHDFINSVNLITDEYGDPIHRVIYKPYGEAHLLTAPMDNQEELDDGFTGQEAIEGTGLYYYGARFYDPKLSFFITPDSELGTHPFGQDAFNRYAYATGNPIMFNDPSGHFIIGIVVGILVGMAFGAISDIISQGISNNWQEGWFNGRQFLMSVAIGGITGLVTAGVSAGITAGLSQLVARTITNISTMALRGVNTAIGYISGYTAGIVGQTTTNLLELGLKSEGFYGGHENSINWGESLAVASLTGGIFGAFGGFAGANKFSAKVGGKKKFAVSNKKIQSYRNIKYGGKAHPKKQLKEDYTLVSQRRAMNYLETSKPTGKLGNWQQKLSDAVLIGTEEGLGIYYAAQAIVPTVDAGKD